MKLYNCKHCGNALYFENSLCLKCQHNIGFNPIQMTMVTLETRNNVDFSDVTNNQAKYHYCENASHSTCNWLVKADQAPFCLACSLNRTIPKLSHDGNLDKWKRIELAKHRLIYSLLRLQVPVNAKIEPDDEEGLAFDFMSDTSKGKRIMTGHANGVITINIEEADEAIRVQHKLDLGEKYRTLLGHMRHEVGHYYWDVLIKDSNYLDQYRQLFGDERQDYSEALNSYYENGPVANWNDSYISPYATSHSWEDWAETWAHYLHLMDTLETAHAFGIDIYPTQLGDNPKMQTEIYQDPYTIKDFKQIMDMWLPLTFAVNSLNRSMGHIDFYPFVIAPAVLDKLQFIHDVCGANRLN
ncbi:zinc-binding metallopeptidase family protein [Chondrinema litorale]|uniref:zinc-binding metallopeptidase family protein n=1 Tax=Chondrinema litorale TaxID=2994555 RepID=UPI0025428E74|nr:putative zinc-binding peptidase [Chondrinema litorale]UZR97193.1 putative zinc-binding peptidase [Chondrinema litorale]